MSRFWRDWRQQLIDEHRAAGHVVAGTKNCLDETHLDEWFWTVMERASDEQREHGRDEFQAEVRQAADAYRAWQGRQYVDAVLRRVQDRRELEIRRARIRLKLAMIERGIPELTEAERAAIRRVTA